MCHSFSKCRGDCAEIKNEGKHAIRDQNRGIETIISKYYCRVFLVFELCIEVSQFQSVSEWMFHFVCVPCR
jgi:hypothetical protein